MSPGPVVPNRKPFTLGKRKTESVPIKPGNEMQRALKSLALREKGRSATIAVEIASSDNDDDDDKAPGPSTKRSKTTTGRKTPSGDPPQDC